MSKHKTHDDIHIKPQHRVGQGTLHVAVPQEQVHLDDDGSQEESSEDEGAPSDDENVVQDEEEEQFAQESYRALK